VPGEPLLARHADLPVTGADLTWPLALATPAARRPGAAARALIGMIR
jgi:hypothetical protein